MAKVGAPTKYKKEYCEKADDYLSECQDVFSDDKKLKVKLPTIEGFSRYLDVNKTSLYEWEKKNKEFSNALDKIRIEQRERLINMGLSGDYTPVIAKLVLSANHGMNEKTETESKITHSLDEETAKNINKALDEV